MEQKTICIDFDGVYYHLLSGQKYLQHFLMALPRKISFL